MNEKYRLQVHYSVTSGWMNDPSGLIYFHGYYHLFYQYIDDAITHKLGNLSWGHAKSKDLIHWENLPVALKPYDKGEMFTGSCLLDSKNVTGFARTMSKVPLIAMYTIHKDKVQSQAISYSFDEGITWIHYEKNPIMPNPGILDFRDPNIFERNDRFYLSLAYLQHISFYTSTDLKNWTWISDFGMPQIKFLQWECPIIIRLKDEQNNEHDILVISINVPIPNTPIGTYWSEMKYFIGQFDGTRYTPYNQSRMLWFDNGRDNYASSPFSKDPHGRIIFLGWMSNWRYANQIPTSIWRGQMTIPRQVALKTVNGNLYLTQRPVDELETAIDTSRRWKLPKPLILIGKQTINLTQKIPFKTGSILTMEYAIFIGNVGKGNVGVRFSNNLGEFISFYFNINEGIYEFDRRSSGNVSFHPDVAQEVRKAVRIKRTTLLSGRIILDTTSIEIFADHGLNVFSSLFFPTELFEHIEIITENTNNSVTVERLRVEALNSIWK